MCVSCGDEEGLGWDADHVVGMARRAMDPKRADAVEVLVRSVVDGFDTAGELLIQDALKELDTGTTTAEAG